MSLALEELDISGNSMDETCSDVFNLWITEMVSDSRLRRLAVAGNSLEAGKFFASAKDLSMDSSLEFLPVNFIPTNFQFRFLPVDFIPTHSLNLEARIFEYFLEFLGSFT